MRCQDVFAVIVTYNPDLDVLDRLLEVLLPQVGGAVIIDNGSEADISVWHRKWQFANCSLKLLGRNLGIAAAQNLGVEEARSHAARFVLLSDQDSRPADDMVQQLRNAAVLCLDSGRKLAAVGPCYLDSRQNNPPPFIRVKGLRIERQTCSGTDSVVEVDYLIASGCLIPVATFDTVGGMREHLFIDYVDIEWGLRARRLGFKSYGVWAAKMEHSLGENPIVFGSRRIPLHSAMRHYYHFRNAVWLYKQSSIPLNWKLADGLRLVRKYGFYTMFAKPRSQHLKMMTLGVVHGLISRLGKIEWR